MSDQDGRQVSALPRPSTEDTKAWKAHWRSQGQHWRTQPEIDTERQKELDDRRKIVPDIQRGIYPFKGMKLSRADVEWLLATHENGRGPVDWSDNRRRKRNGLDLRGADLHQANLRRLPLAFTLGGLFLDEWFNVTEEQRNMAAILMSEADLSGAYLERAILRGAHLEGASLRGAHLEHASLREANLEGSILAEAHLNGTALLDASLSDQKHVGPTVADTNWGDVNLAVVKWSSMKMLGDEQRAHQTKALNDYNVAVRANRQLAVALRDQGLNEEADRFAYRAQLLQREVWRRQHRYLKYIGSWLLWLLAGYGYKPIRSVLAYLVIIFGFMGIYLLNAHFIAPYLTWDEALVLSVSSFHGRGFFTQNVTLGDTYARLAAIEAAVGLFIEISFIATFTQRFFGK